MKAPMNTAKLHSLILLAALTLNLAAPAQAAGYLKISDIKGESQAAQAENSCNKPVRANTTAGKPSPVTYGPVITIKPKGMHQAKDKTPQPGPGVAAIEERKKCYTHH